MDENSHEPCDPTVADVGYRKSNVANQLPSYDTHNAVCFAWPATTVAARRYASRLMVEQYRAENRVSSGHFVAEKTNRLLFPEQGRIETASDIFQGKYSYNIFFRSGDATSSR